MTREDLISYLSEHLVWPESDTTKAVEAFLDTIVEELMAGNRVDIGGFGLFQARKHSEYILVDGETNERYLMPPSLEIIFEAAMVTSDHVSAQDVMLFFPDESLEKEANSPFALFEPTLINEEVQFPGILEVYADERKDENTEMQQAVIEEEPEKAPEEKPENEGVRTSEAEIPRAVIPEAEIPEEEVPGAEILEEEVPEAEILGAEIPGAKILEVEVPEAVSTGKPKKDTEKSIENEPVPKAAVSVKKRKKRSSIWMPVIGGVAIALAVLFFFKATRTEKKLTTAKEDELPLKASHVIPSPTAEWENRPQPQSQPQPLQDTSSLQTREKVILEKGKTLRLLAFDLFGSKDFWVYIYLENRDVIHNPNIIPIGTELLVPDRTAYLLDATNAEAIVKAKSIADDILKKFTD